MSFFVLDMISVVPKVFQACRCFRVQDHERAHLVSADDKNLAIAITRYMDKFSTNSFNQPDFYRYYKRQNIDCAVSGVRAERFHYLSEGKDMVCRCNRHEHLNCRKVHSPEIQELCAEFFQNNATKTTCTREQWRASGIRDPESLHRVLIHYTDSEPVSKLSTPRRDYFEYDSPSVVETLRNREKSSPSASQRSSRPSPGFRRRHSKENPRPSGDVAHLSNGPNGEADIPENVWRMSQPSMYLERHKTESLVSTLLGSSATSVQQNVYVDPAPRGNQPSILDIVTEVRGTRYPTDVWYDFSHSPGSSGLGSPIKYLGPHAACSPRYNFSSVKTELDIADLEKVTAARHVAELSGRENVVCWSEEEVAAAQLWLLKDYVDAHADELYREWRPTCFEARLA
ncbi:hypothetical protein BU25DRAFT_463824 [Macroventuria anomochaeta]|uniref:Uncharacterized protein n=1 Tax=Macroventuria anomochaeta TaxID=301207 RepID=A0ACB6RHB1_9PLEO|nr:uncharacterized protein BU25DRAFT_463824 [Macroventuria anomochaeta]KAF2621336.1 hypothetical protein BU25DRAFT_463824 [Macroventuria anomochaeta]